jgi:hypothetical protein
MNIQDLTLPRGYNNTKNYAKYLRRVVVHSNRMHFRIGRRKLEYNETIILPVVLYGCETWSLTLGEGHRLSVFENRVLRRIF